MQYYAELTADWEGIETINGNARGKCWGGDLS